MEGLLSTGPTPSSFTNQRDVLFKTVSELIPNFMNFTMKRKLDILLHGINNNPSEKIGQSGGSSRWRVCYQRGLPRLV